MKREEILEVAALQGEFVDRLIRKDTAEYGVTGFAERVSSLTSTVSLIEPILRRKSILMSLPTSTWTRSRTSLVKPCASTVME
jgi:hypothetical protein